MAASFLLNNSDFAYPLAVATVGTYAVLGYATTKVSAARKAAKVDYPAAYADNAVAERDIKAKQFNCAQRAHMNTLENLPLFLISLLHSSLYHPKYAAGAGLFWIFGRLAYISGYSTGEPKKRMNGSFQYLGFLPLFGYSIFKAVTALPVVQQFL
ncbi:hypothetical protein JCM8097_005879 [Rhodosporidiobolus ruineniae]